jgi:hypothetical protein
MKVTVELNISSEDYLAYYQGMAKSVIATDMQGKRVRFPSNILRPFVTHNGIHGTFEILFDDDNKFLKIQKI